MFVPLLCQYIGFSSLKQCPANIVLLLVLVSPLVTPAVSGLLTYGSYLLPAPI